VRIYRESKENHVKIVTVSTNIGNIENPCVNHIVNNEEAVVNRTITHREVEALSQEVDVAGTSRMKPEKVVSHTLIMHRGRAGTSSIEAAVDITIPNQDAAGLSTTILGVKRTKTHHSVGTEAEECVDSEVASEV
jgi:hypothetical protein